MSDAPKFQRRKDARPGELIDAARKEFSEHGFGDARLARVAKRAGVSNGTLYHYFSDKSELFQAVFRATFVDPLAGGPAAPMKPSADLLASAVGQLLDEETLSLIAILLFEADRYPDPVGRIASEVMTTAEAMLGAFLAGEDGASDELRAYPLGLVAQTLTVALIEKARGNADWAAIARRTLTAQIKSIQRAN